MVLHTHGSDLVSCGHAFDGVGIHHSSVDREDQSVAVDALQLEGQAGADSIGCCLIQGLPFGPAGDRTAGSAAAVGVGALVIVDTEGMGLTCNGSTQGHAEADLAVAVMGLVLGQIVLDVYSDGGVFAGDIGPPGIIVGGVIGVQDTVSLVCKVPAVCVQSSDVQGGYEVAGDVVSFFGGLEAVGIGLPIQLQGLTVDVQLLGIALSGSDGQSDSIADLVAFLVSGNGAIGHFCDVQLNISNILGNSQLVGNLDLCCLVAIVDYTHGYDLVGPGHTFDGVGLQHSTVDGDLEVVAVDALQLEFCAVGVQSVDGSCILLAEQSPCTAPAGGRTAAAEVVVGIDLICGDPDAEGIVLAIVHGSPQGDAETAAVGCAFIAVCHAHVVLGIDGDALVVAGKVCPPGVIVAGVVGVNNTVSLVCEVPAICIRSGDIQSGDEGTGDIVDFLGGHEAVGVGLPIQLQRLTVDVQLLGIALSGSNGELDGIANLVGFLTGGDGAVGQFVNVQLNIGTNLFQLYFIGDLDLLTLVTMVLHTQRGDLVSCGNAFDGVGIHHDSVDGKGQGIAAAALQFEGQAGADGIGCCLIQSLPFGPAGDRSAGCTAAVSVSALVVIDTESMGLTGNGSPQGHAEANLAVAVMGIVLGQIVLDVYSNGGVIAGDISPPGIIVGGVIGIQDAVSLVCEVPAVCVQSSDVQGGFEGAGDVVNLLGGLETVGLGLPIQHQRLTVDVQLLAVAGVGSHSQDDGVTNLIAHAVGGDGAVGQLGNVDPNLSSGIHQFEGDLHFLTQVAVHTDLDAYAGIGNAAILTGGHNLAQIQGGDLHLVDVDQSFTLLGGDPEVNAGIGDLGSFCIAECVVVFPCGGKGGAGHDLHSVLAVTVGVVQAQTQSFTIGEGEVIDHGEVLGIGICILDQGADVVAINCSGEPAGVTGIMAFQLEQTQSLLSQSPCAVRVLGKAAGSEGGADMVDVFGGDKAVGAVPIGLHRLAVDQQTGVVVALIALQGEGDGLAQLIDFLIRNHGAMADIVHKDLCVLGGIHQLEGNNGGLADIAIQTQGDLGGGLIDTAGLAGFDDLGQIVGADLGAIQVDMSGIAQNLDTVGNAVVHDLLGLLVGQGVAVFPGGSHGASGHALNTVLTIVIGVVQTNTQLLSVGELEDIDHGVIIGLRRQIACDGGDIIGVQNGIQPGIYALDTKLDNLTGILTGDIPGVGGNVEGGAYHVHRGAVDQGEGEVHDLTVGDPGFHTDLSGAACIGSIEFLNLNQGAAQPDGCVVALTHDRQFDTLFTGVLVHLVGQQSMDSLPVEDGVIAGMLCILQDVLIAFLQQVDVPVLVIAELDTHTGTLLDEGIRGTLLSQLGIIVQGEAIGEGVVDRVAEHMASATELLHDTVVLLIHDEAGALGGEEQVVLQQQLGVHIPVEENAALDGAVAFLLSGQDIVALLHVL